MAIALFLTPEELHGLTGDKSPKGQCRWLKANHWKHVISASGRPIVARDYFRQVLGVSGIEEVPEAPYQPNFAALGTAH